MKNISQFATDASKVLLLVKTDCCETTSLCPFCGGSHAVYVYNSIYRHIPAFQMLEEELNPDISPYHLFCDRCKIIFSEGCSHTNQDAYGPVWNAHLIGKYTFQGHTYVGMPMYETMEEWLTLSPQVKIEQWICPNGGYIDPKATYTEEFKLKHCICHLPTFVKE